MVAGHIEGAKHGVRIDTTGVLTYFDRERSDQRAQGAALSAEEQQAVLEEEKHRGVVAVRGHSTQRPR